MKIEDIAKVCHEANKALCESDGDFSQKTWDEAEEWQSSLAAGFNRKEVKNATDFKRYRG